MDIYRGICPVFQTQKELALLECCGVLFGWVFLSRGGEENPLQPGLSV